MAQDWYYVDGSERVGPISQNELEELYESHKINKDSYIWCKGFENWEHLKNVKDFSHLLEDSPSQVSEIPSLSNTPSIEAQSVNLDQLSSDQKVFTIKVGYDRGGNETEYGPFSLNQLRMAFQEKRINDKTFVFAAGMENWQLLGDFKLFDQISDSLPPKINDADRRVSVRKPFIARMLFHDNNSVFEGICRDISVGGLQVLVSEFPGKVGDSVSLNVHPDNSDYHFTASGTVVRKLDGDAGFSLRFKNLSTVAYQAINQYVDEN